MSTTSRFVKWSEKMRRRFGSAGYHVRIEQNAWPLNSSAYLELESDKYLGRITGHDRQSMFHFQVIDVPSEQNLMDAHCEDFSGFTAAFNQFFEHLGIDVQGLVPFPEREAA